MKQQDVTKLRNIGLISHGGAGKTSLAEAMLHCAGVTDRLGRTDDGTTVMDHDPEEIRRQTSINAAIAACPWQDCRVNVIDTPGYFDFVGEVKAALRVVDGGVLVVEAVSGVEVGTELVWGYAADLDVPLICFINKMDRENADFNKVLDGMKLAFSDTQIVPVQIPIGQEASFTGVVDLISETAYQYRGDVAGTFEQIGIPDELSDQAAQLREQLVEAAAEGSDDLIEKYLEGDPLTVDEIIHGLRGAVRARKVLPVLCGSSTKNVAVRQLLDSILSLLPSPADRPPVTGKNPRTEQEETRAADAAQPFSALVFKTMADPYVGKLTLFRVYSGSLNSDSQVYNATRGRTERIGQLFFVRGKHQEPAASVAAGDLAAVAKLQETTTGDTLSDEASPIMYPAIEFPSPVYTVAVVPKSKGDEEKIGAGLSRLSEEDLTFRFDRQSVAGQMVISGMGDLHLDVITDRLKRKFGADVLLQTPRTPYKETIRSSVKVEGKHKKQTGGRGQFGHVWLELQPTSPDTEFEFEDKIFGGSVPRQYIPAVEKGLREVLPEGVVAGYPVTGVKVILYDGSYHTVDSSEMAFKIAASMAFKKGFQQCGPVLLEPIVKVEVMVPDAFMGDVIGDLNKKRGRILGMEPKGSMQEVRALAPMAEMSRYAIDLRSITQGRGTFMMEIVGYEEVPSNLAQEIIAAKESE